MYCRPVSVPLRIHETPSHQSLSEVLGRHIVMKILYNYFYVFQPYLASTGVDTQ